VGLVGGCGGGVGFRFCGWGVDWFRLFFYFVWVGLILRFFVGCGGGVV